MFRRATLTTKIISGIFALFLLFLPAMSFAVDVIAPVCDGQNGINESAVCRDNTATSTKNPLFGPEGVLTKGISIISFIVAVVAVIVIIIAAIRFMASQGNPQTISLARNTIIYAAIGLAVAAIAQGLVAFVLKKL